jgi:hypothetical protein
MCSLLSGDSPCRVRERSTRIDHLAGAVDDGALMHRHRREPRSRARHSHGALKTSLLRDANSIKMPHELPYPTRAPTTTRNALLNWALTDFLVLFEKHFFTLNPPIQLGDEVRC